MYARNKKKKLRFKVQFGDWKHVALDKPYGPGSWARHGDDDGSPSRTRTSRHEGTERPSAYVRSGRRDWNSWLVDYIAMRFSVYTVAFCFARVSYFLFDTLTKAVESTGRIGVLYCFFFFRSAYGFPSNEHIRVLVCLYVYRARNRYSYDVLLLV